MLSPLPRDALPLLCLCFLQYSCIMSAKKQNISVSVEGTYDSIGFIDSDGAPFWG